MKRSLTILVSLIFITISQNTWTQESMISGCGLDKKSRQLAKLIIESTEQHRQQLVCNKDLARAANLKAHLLAKVEKITHNIDNITPNELLQNQGIELPFAYQNLGNQVEVILGGMETPQESFDYFMTSPDHKAHILGENNFYQNQNQIGVGYFLDENTKYEEYWVVYITALRTNNEPFDTNIKFKTQIMVKPISNLLQTNKIRSVDKKFSSNIKPRVSKAKK